MDQVWGEERKPERHRDREILERENMKNTTKVEETVVLQLDLTVRITFVCKK